MRECQKPVNRVRDLGFADVAKSQTEISFQSRAEGFSGERHDTGFADKATGNLTSGNTAAGVTNPGEEGTAGHQTEGVAVTAEFADKTVMALRHHVPVGFDPGIEMVDTEPYELHGQTLTSQIGVVRWTGGSLADSQFDDFAISAKFPDSAGETLYFPTIQYCGGKTA